MHACVAGVALVVGLAGCPKHENFPTQLEVVVPPTPANFTVDNPDPQTADYDLSWTISDPSIVDHYRVYLLGGGVVPDELLAEQVMGTSYSVDMQLRAAWQFGVSAVSTGHVEGERAVATATYP